MSKLYPWTVVALLVAGLTAAPAAAIGVADVPTATGASGGSGGSTAIDASETGTLQSCNYSSVYDDVIDGVVLVQTQGGLGSGFVWPAENGMNATYVVTNEHVVRDANQVLIQFSRGETSVGTVVGTDQLLDVAVVRVNRTPDYVESLPIANRPAEPGEAVAAVGSPFGLERTITQGIVSGVNRSVPTETGFPIPLTIQTDAAINPGNSGGPLVSCEGVVLGINRAGGGEDIGFAVSNRMLERVVPTLIQQGEFEHPFLGIQTTNVGPLIASINVFNVTRGVYVVDVAQGGPASGVLQGATDVEVVSGTRVPIGGDVILAVENATVTNQHDLLAHLLTETQPGETVQLTILRNGERRTVNVTLGERSEPEQA